jgi:succinate dehydrogenase / fumarate reductase cytochrome b subunit
MSWFTKFLTSSIGQKLIMSLTGLFLILFLLVHLTGNFQLMFADGGEAFNKYAYFMTHNPLIKTVSIGLYAFILLHAVQGILLARKNRASRGKARYAVNKTRAVATNAFAAKNMALLGILILAFIFLHMGDFWFAMKSENLPQQVIAETGDSYQDLYIKVFVSFQELWVVIAYLIGLVALAFHLLHGFQSAFQTLGLNHKKYTPVIKFLGVAYSVLVPLGYAIMPLYFFIGGDALLEGADAIAQRIGEYQWWLGKTY